MNLDDFSTTVDDMRYINPQVGLDESNAFIENLRNTQGQRTAEIAEDTYNLGTAVPSNLGGLGGAGTYFTSRYQTPQTNEIVANLRTTAQAQALNDAMNNVLAQAKQRYNKAYKNYQRRNHISPSPATTVNMPGDVDYRTTGDELTLRYKGTEGGVSTGATGGAQAREYYFLGPNGQRTPVNFIGSGSSIAADTPMHSYGGSEAVNRYIQSMINNGHKLMARKDDGRVVDITGGYHINLGI